MKRLFTLIFISLLSCSWARAQFHYLSGRVTNHSLEPMGFVTVKVIGQTGGAITNAKGEYRVSLPNGRYEVLFTFLGYKTEKVVVVINGRDQVKNIIMTEDEKMLEDMVVKAKKEDPSEGIIRQVIKHKEEYLSQPRSYNCTVYIKAYTEEESTAEGKKKKNKRKTSDTLKTRADTIPDINMTEITLQKYYEYPNRLKEVTDGKKVRGDPTDLFYLSTTAGDFNFYHNLVSIPSLSESPFQSPVSYGGLIAYKYKYEGSYFVDDQKIHRIKVSPGLMGNALVSGTIEIMDSLWCIKKFSFTFPKYHVVKYDQFTLTQEYEYVNDSAWTVTRQEFSYVIRSPKTRLNGRTVVTYSHFNLSPRFSKSFFGNELSVTTKEAYERDSAFWNTIRTEPLTEKEVQFIRRNDSIEVAHQSKSYLDSIDRDFNKITFAKLVFTGQGYYKRQTETRLLFKPLLFVYEPINVGGHRVSYWMLYDKTFKDKRNFYIAPDLSYGINNHDLKGSVSIRTLYDPFRRGEFFIDFGKDFDMINPNDAWINLFKRSNFYEHRYLNFAHRIEITNGLYLRAGFEIADRRSIAGYKFNELADTLFGEPNKVVAFFPYTAFYGVIDVSWVPGQKYLREPYEKVILGSKFPTFTVRYRKGVPGFMSSAVNFDYAEFLITHEFKVGLAGVSKYNFSTGTFLNDRSLHYVDYKFQRRGGPYFFSNPMYTFQLLDSSFPTFKPFYQFHYFHRFNGAILNKIPILKKLELIEAAGAGFLIAPERNLQYAEAFVGVEKVVRLFKERFKIGLFACTAWANTFQQPFQLKFTIEYFDRRSNTWRY